MRRTLELDRDRGLASREPLAHAYVERRICPAPVVDVELRRHVGLRHRPWVNGVLLAVTAHLLAFDEAAPVLAAHYRLRTGRVHRTQHLHLLVAHGLRREVDRRLHGGDREQLQQVVLEDVADRTRLLVIARAPLDADRLRDRDLHVVDELTIPDRLEDAVREPQRQHVLHGLLAEVVVDAKDLVLGEVLVDDRRELPRGFEIVTERFLDDETRPALSFRAVPPERTDDRGKDARRDGEIKDAIALQLAL